MADGDQYRADGEDLVERTADAADADIVDQPGRGSAEQIAGPNGTGIVCPETDRAGRRGDKGKNTKNASPSENRKCEADRADDHDPAFPLHPFPFVDLEQHAVAQHHHKAADGTDDTAQPEKLHTEAGVAQSLQQKQQFIGFHLIR